MSGEMKVSSGYALAALGLMITSVGLTAIAITAVGAVTAPVAIVALKVAAVIAGIIAVASLGSVYQMSSSCCFSGGNQMAQRSVTNCTEFLGSLYNGVIYLLVDIIDKCCCVG